jgi:hypothetical protein
MYDATVLEVFIASPSDTVEQREVIHDAVVRWNETESRRLGVVLLPAMWETHTHPDLSDAPQPIINKQVVDNSDVVIATFWTRLGTPTQDGESGTVEEIERAREADRPVLLYFCDMPVAPLESDTSTIEALKDYKARIQTQGLYSSYTSTAQLRDKVQRDLGRVVHEMRSNGRLPDKTVGGVPVAADNRTTAAEVVADPVAGALDELRGQLRGYVAKWESIVGSFPGDWNAGTRQALAREIENVALQIVQRVATVAPEAPVIASFSGIAQKAHAVADTPLSLDGGRSFNELSNGCITLVENASELVKADWPPQSETTG